MAKIPACTQCGGRLSPPPGETGKLRCDSCGKVFKIAAKPPQAAPAAVPAALPVDPVYDLQPLGLQPAAAALQPLAPMPELMPLSQPMPFSSVSPGGPTGAQNLFGPSPYPYCMETATGSPQTKAQALLLKVAVTGAVILLVAVPIGILQAVLQHRAKEWAARGGAPAVQPSVNVPSFGTPSASGGAAAALAKLRDSSLMARPFDRDELLRSLQTMPVEESQRESIARELLPHARSNDFLVSEGAQKALVHWAPPVMVNEVAEVAAGSKHLFVRNDLLATVANFTPDARTAQILAPLLDQPGSPFDLQRIYTKIGSSGEPPVLALLAPGKPYYNDAIFQVLQVIGTQASVARLKEIAEDPLFPNSASARTTAFAIEQRVKAGGA